MCAKICSPNETHKQLPLEYLSVSVDCQHDALQMSDTQTWAHPRIQIYTNVSKVLHNGFTYI